MAASAWLRTACIAAAAASFAWAPGDLRTQASAASCAPTKSLPLPDYYRADAPRRGTVGDGYVLSGTVRSATGCRALARARVEFFSANGEGRYDLAHRGIVLTGRNGRYRIETDFPPKVYTHPPHIHLVVSASRHRRVVTEFFPRYKTSSGRFDVVLPARRSAR